MRWSGPTRELPAARPAERSTAGLGQELALAVLGKAAAAFGTIGFASLTPFIRDEFDLSAVGIGGVMGAIFLGGLLATVPAGRLTDRVRAGRMLGACLLAEAAGLALVAAAPSTPLLYLAIGVVGAAMSAGDPSTNVLVSLNVSSRRRGLLMGVKQTGLTIGGLLGGLVLPSLASATSWHVAVFVPVAACAAVGLYGLRVGGSTLESPRAAPEPVRTASLIGIGAYGFLMSGIQLSILSYLAVYLVDEESLTETTAGLAIAVALAGATIGRIAWGAISDRLLHSRVLVLQLASIGAAATLVALSLAGASAGLWPVLFLLGFCAVGWNTVYVTVVAESVPARSVGKATGEALFFNYAGCVALPPLLGLVRDGSGSWLVTWLATAAAAFTALVACRVLVSRVPR